MRKKFFLILHNSSFIPPLAVAFFPFAFRSFRFIRRIFDSFGCWYRFHLILDYHSWICRLFILALIRRRIFSCWRHVGDEIRIRCRLWSGIERYAGLLTSNFSFFETLKLFTLLLGYQILDIGRDRWRRRKRFPWLSLHENI